MSATIRQCIDCNRQFPPQFQTIGNPGDIVQIPPSLNKWRFAPIDDTPERLFSIKYVINDGFATNDEEARRWIENYVNDAARSGAKAELVALDNPPTPPIPFRGATNIFNDFDIQKPCTSVKLDELHNPAKRALVIDRVSTALDQLFRLRSRMLDTNNITTPIPRDHLDSYKTRNVVSFASGGIPAMLVVGVDTIKVHQLDKETGVIKSRDLNTIVLKDLVVDETARNKGIASLIFDAVVALMTRDQTYDAVMSEYIINPARILPIVTKRGFKYVLTEFDRNMMLVHPAKPELRRWVLDIPVSVDHFPLTNTDIQDFWNDNPPQNQNQNQNQL